MARTGHETDETEGPHLCPLGACPLGAARPRLLCHQALPRPLFGLNGPARERRCARRTRSAARGGSRCSRSMASAETQQAWHGSRSPLARAAKPIWCHTGHDEGARRSPPGSGSGQPAAPSRARPASRRGRRPRTRHAGRSTPSCGPSAWTSSPRCSGSGARTSGESCRWSRPRGGCRRRTPFRRTSSDRGPP